MKGKKADNCVSVDLWSVSLPVSPCHSLSLARSLSLSVWPHELWMGAHLQLFNLFWASTGITKQLDDREVHLQAWHAGYGHPSRRPIRCSAGQHVYTAELEGCWVCYAPVPLPLPYSLLPRDLPHLGTYIRRITRVYHMTHTDLTGMLQPSLASGI